MRDTKTTTMKTTYYLFDERFPSNGEIYESIDELRDYASSLNSNGKDWGMWDDEPVEEASPSDLSEVLYGSWGRVKEIEGWRFEVRCCENGNVIDVSDTYHEAELLLLDYEDQDDEDGNYEIDFYEIYDRLTETINK